MEEIMMESLETTHVSLPPLHWNLSSNVLCNYMKEQSYLDLILKNRAIIPRYVIESVKYLAIDGLDQICFPMTCFCDIPFSKVSVHMSRYGKYGIGLDKEAVLKKYHVQPVHYMNPDSPLAIDFKEAFSKFYKTDKKLPGDAYTLVNYLASTLMYMKPIWGIEAGTNESYVYQDECEWRYIPSNNFPENLHLILKQAETTEIGRDTYSEALKSHPESWLAFEWAEVQYIIVPDEVAERNTIHTLLSLSLEEEEKHKLISKIEISRRFSENM